MQPILSMIQHFHFTIDLTYHWRIKCHMMNLWEIRCGIGDKYVWTIIAKSHLITKCSLYWQGLHCKMISDIISVMRMHLWSNLFHYVCFWTLMWLTDEDMHTLIPWSYKLHGIHAYTRTCICSLLVYFILLADLLYGYHHGYKEIIFRFRTSRCRSPSLRSNRSLSAQNLEGIRPIYLGENNIQCIFHVLW